MPWGRPPLIQQILFAAALAVSVSAARASDSADVNAGEATVAALQPAHLGPYLNATTFYSSVPTGTEADYLQSLAEVLAAHVRYAADARKPGDQACAVTRVTFTREGVITALAVIRKTGRARLDIEANNVFVRIARFPEVPADLMPDDDLFEVDLPTIFSMR